MIQQSKHTFSMITNYRCWAIAVLVTFTCLPPSQDTLGQDLGLGDTGIADLQQLDQQQSQIGGNTGTGNGGGDGIDAFTAEDADLLSGVSSDDVRNQGFVGATGERIQELGFVGPPGETSGPPLADGASFGGGVNDGGGGGGFGGGNAGRNQQNGFGGFGQGKGFQVIRKGVRTALSPRFASPTRSNAEISNRFNNRIGRLPVMANDGGGLSVSINQRVATVTGYAQTEAERSRFIRQLRLEPGIDRVIDQVTR